MLGGKEGRGSGCWGRSSCLMSHLSSETDGHDLHLTLSSVVALMRHNLAADEFYYFNE